MLWPVGLAVLQSSKSETANILPNQKEYSVLLLLQRFQHVQLEGWIDREIYIRVSL